MRKKLLLGARGGLSFWSNRNLRLTRLSLSRPPKWVPIEASNSVGQSNTQWRGWSYTASVPSYKPDSQKGRKVSKDERRAMVESYVNKYRAMNDGKFPTLKDTQKQVGGGYYFVREILQELKYKSKLNSSNNMDKSLVGKDNFDASKLLASETVKVPSDITETAKDRAIQEDFQLVVLDEINAGHEHLEDKRGPQTTTYEGSLSKEAQHSHFIAAESNHLQREVEEPSKSSERTSFDVKKEEAEASYSDTVVSETHPIKEEIQHISALFSEISGNSQSKVVDSEFSDVDNHTVMKKTSTEKAEYERREHGTLEDFPGIDGQKHTMEQGHGTSDMSESKIDNSNREMSDAEVPKKTTLWGNLKLFADGILNIWKKL